MYFPFHGVNTVLYWSPGNEVDIDFNTIVGIKLYLFSQQLNGKIIKNLSAFSDKSIIVPIKS